MDNSKYLKKKKKPNKIIMLSTVVLQSEGQIKTPYDKQKSTNPMRDAWG